MRIGPVAFSRAAIADIGRAFLWLSQPGGGHNAAARLESLSRAIYDVAHEPYRWPPHAVLPGMRQRAVRGGYLIVYRVIESGDAGHEAAYEVEIARLFGPGQRRLFGTPGRREH